jgi:hypothetical protein
MVPWIEKQMARTADRYVQEVKEGPFEESLKAVKTRGILVGLCKAYREIMELDGEFTETLAEEEINKARERRDNASD